MKKNLLIIAAALAFVGASCESAKSGSSGVEVESLTQYVDLNIGTGDHGHVFMGANVPFGFIQLGPSQTLTDKKDNWDWCSGFHVSDSTIYGFSHQHLSGTGIGDLGDVTMMPVVAGKKGRKDRFNPKNVEVHPGYYSVIMDTSQIKVELTATKRVGLHRYTYPNPSEPASVVFDLNYGIGWDAWTDSQIKQENDSIISGYRMSKGWAKDQRVYFVAEFSRRITSIKGNKMVSTLTFAPSEEPLLARVALSPVSVANAKANMAAEAPDWNFDGAIVEADKAWNAELSKIMIETEDESAKKIFYTAMFHSMVAPSVFCDVNGEYRGSDGKVYKDNFVNYTTFSLWDTYRAAHPLSTLIHPEKQADFAKTFINIFKQQGKLPVWHLMGNETDCMVGNPGVIVLADLVLKGYVDEKDYEDAFNALKTSVMLDERGMDMLKEYDYLPYDGDGEPETVARGMEYAIADWCVAKVAEKLGKKEDFEYFNKRSRAYTHYFDSITGFMRGLGKDGQFREPFSPFAAQHRQDDYTEGNGWQYLWLVPHDVKNLVGLLGGDDKFVTKLDSLFVVTGDMGAEASPDISGLIGQYAHGNEPSHHVIYMYNYVGKPWKAAKLLRYVMSELYHSEPAGLCGNEDVGQMSAWYILSSLGLYQVEPAGGKYVFGSPIFDSAVINLGNDKEFKITTVNNSKENIYVQSVKLNGKNYDKSYIMYDDIKAGGTLEFTMGAEPSEAFGVAPEARP